MVYNILASSFSDLTNPPVQYSIYEENRLYWLRCRSQETVRLAFLALLMQRRGCLTLASLPENEASLSY